MAEGWHYFATTLNGDGTETRLRSSLPLDDVEITTTLSGDSGLRFTVNPSDPRLMDANGPIFREWSTATYAEYNGEIRGAGIVESTSTNGPALSVDCTSWTGYARGLPYTGNGYAGVKVDPLDVVRVIWSHIQSQRGGNIGLNVDSRTKVGKLIGTEMKQAEYDTKSGPLKFEAGPVKLNWHSTHDLAGEIDSLAKEYAFDYLERHRLTPDGVEHYLDFGAPRIGRRREDVIFRWGVNVMPELQYTDDGGEYASGALVLGAGEGAAMTHTILEPPTRPENRLRRIAVVTDDRINQTAAAVKRAREELQWRKILRDVSTVQVHDHPSARLSSIKVGDEVRLLGRGEWDKLDMWARITEVSYRPEDGDRATYKIVRTDKILED